VARRAIWLHRSWLHVAGCGLVPSVVGSSFVSSPRCIGLVPTGSPKRRTADRRRTAHPGRRRRTRPPGVPPGPVRGRDLPPRQRRPGLNVPGAVLLGRNPASARAGWRPAVGGVPSYYGTVSSARIVCIRRAHRHRSSRFPHTKNSSSRSSNSSSRACLRVFISSPCPLTVDPASFVPSLATGLVSRHHEFRVIHRGCGAPGSGP
jgi:hypothetical protein